MAPGKGGNSKKEAGRAKKAENEAKKKSAIAAEKERKEAGSWQDKDVKGGKTAKEVKEEKRRADLARKAESARLLAEEEANVPSQVKIAPKAGQKKKAELVKATIASSAPSSVIATGSGGQEIESFSASGIDNALDLIEAVTAKTDKASLGQQGGLLERHPERRFKAAFEEYQERELPRVKEDHPGLRLQQYKELLYKQFQKSPDNPFNQTTVAYDATKDEVKDTVSLKRGEVENRLRDN